MRTGLVTEIDWESLFMFNSEVSLAGEGGTLSFGSISRFFGISLEFSSFNNRFSRNFSDGLAKSNGCCISFSSVTATEAAVAMEPVLVSGTFSVSGTIVVSGLNSDLGSLGGVG